MYEHLVISTQIALDRMRGMERCTLAVSRALTIVLVEFTLVHILLSSDYTYVVLILVGKKRKGKEKRDHLAITESILSIHLAY